MLKKTDVLYYQYIMMLKDSELHFCSIGSVVFKVHSTVIFLLIGAAILAIDCSFELVDSISFLAGVLGSLFLHAYGHVIVALILGHRPRKALITAYGDRLFSLSTLENEKLSSLRKILIISAGPITSAAIAALLYPFLTHFPIAYALELSSYIEGLFLFNCYLALINTFAVIPFDGYRFVTTLTGKSREVTKRIYNVNQILLTLVFLLGFSLEAPLLSLISLLVYVQCIKEHFKDQARLVAARYTASDIMTPSNALQIFRHGLPITDASIVALKSLQGYFPVISGSTLRGLVKKAVLRNNVYMEQDHTTVNDIAYDPELVLKSTDTIDCLLDDSKNIQYPIPVINQEKEFVGLITYEQFMEWIAYHMSSHQKELESQNDKKRTTKDSEENQ